MQSHSHLSPLLRAAITAHPVLNAADELTLTRSIVAAHVAAWTACLGALCPRASRRAAILARACDETGVQVWPVDDAPTSIALEDLPAAVSRIRATDRDHHLLHAVQAIVLADCDDTWTSPRASAASVHRAERQRYQVLATARDLGRAEDRMVKHNLGLVLAQANHRRKSGVPFEDLVQEGSAGLLTAVRRFDPERGYRFSTFAMWWVRHAVGRHIVNHGRTVRVPSHLQELVGKILRADHDLYDAATCTPASDAQVAAHLGVECSQVHKARLAVCGAIPLEASTGDSRLALIDTLADDSADPSAALDDARLTARVRAVTSNDTPHLTAREAHVLRACYGLDGDAPTTLADCGASLDLSRERVRQIRQGALARLRPALAAFA